MTRIIFFVMAACLLFSSSCSLAQEQIETKINDFTLSSLEGKQIVLSEILEKKKALLIFWASWCPYCRSELPRVEEFYRQNQDRVMVIAVDVGESRSQVEKVVQRLNLSYPTVLDYDGSIARKYRVLGVPTLVAINQQGEIVYYGHSVQELMMTTEF